MTGVNDLLEQHNNGSDIDGGDLCKVADSAWHPVSKPPTEADTIGVAPLVMVAGGDGADCWDYRSVQEVARSDAEWAKGLYWARIRDVVLMPEE